MSLGKLLANEFRSVDSNEEQAQSRCIHCLDYIRKCPQFGRVRGRAYRQLDLNAKVKRVIDLGCGLGDDCVAIAKLLQKAKGMRTGRVLGIDISEVLLSEASKRIVQEEQTSQMVSFIRGDLRRLSELAIADYVPADRIYEERVLQHIPRDECTSLVGQIFNCLGSGGIFVAVEPYWELFNIYPGNVDVTRKFRMFWADSFNNSRIAETLPEMLTHAGFEKVSRELFTVEYNSFTDAALVYDVLRVLDQMTGSGLISRQEKEHWIAEAQDSSRQHSTVLQMAVIRGRKSDC